ncbi:unnamed protein product [Scytosiphon promiscuus]
MNRSYISFLGVAAAAGFLLASGADVDTLKKRPSDDSVKIAGNKALGSLATSGEWEPAVGESWNYNLMTPVETSVDVDVVMIDMDYAQDTIDLLHSQGKWVVCYISIGTVEDWRDDADDFPDSVIGPPMDGWDGENWLDVNQREVKVIMNKRVRKAQSMNCDGVEPDNMDAYLQEDTGVSVTEAQQLAYNKWFARRVHARGMKVGLKNCVEILSDLVDHFDFAINESCNMWNECDDYGTTFLAQGKPVFNVEYTDDLDMCDYTNSLGMDTIVKDYDLTGKLCSCADSSRDLDCDEVI